MPCSPCWRYGSIRSSMRCTSEPKFLILPNKKKRYWVISIHMYILLQNLFEGKKIAQQRGNAIVKWVNKNRFFFSSGRVYSYHQFKKSKWNPGWCSSMDWFAGSIPSQGTCQAPTWGCTRGNYTLMFLSLPLHLKINKYIFLKKQKAYTLK